MKLHQKINQDNPVHTWFCIHSTLHTVAIILLIISTDSFSAALPESVASTKVSLPLSIDYKIDQYTWDLNCELRNGCKYHSGSDWNGKGGGSTDLNTPILNAIDGVVVYIDNVGKISGKGKQVIVRSNLNGKEIDIAYLHLSSVLVKKYNKDGSRVYLKAGDIIGKLGGTGGWTPHLHIEATETDVPITAASYYNPLTTKTASKYYSPNLLLSDRKESIEVDLDSGRWEDFSVKSNTSINLAIVSLKNKNFSFYEALKSNLIDKRGIIFKEDNQWYFYRDPLSIKLKPGVQYKIRALATPLTFSVSLPEDSLVSRKLRSKQDIISYVSKNRKFSEIRPNEYRESLDFWDDWQLRGIKALYEAGAKQTWIYIYHMTLKDNPLIRYVNFRNPETGKLQTWERLDQDDIL